MKDVLSNDVKVGDTILYFYIRWKTSVHHKVMKVDSFTPKGLRAIDTANPSGGTRLVFNNFVKMENGKALTP